MKKIKATHQGELDLNGLSLTCAVLEDGQRVFSDRSLALAFGIKGGGAYWQKKREKPNGAYLPEYLSAKYIKPFITNELEEKLFGAINYTSTNGKDSSGIPAVLLPEICDVYVRAYKAGIMQTNVSNAANVAHKLIMGFATVGVIALVDEATGYQYDRERDELQKILSQYIAEELMPWSKRFYDEFYIQIFRLNNWDYTVNGIQKRPGVIGRWTNELIYYKLPKGVLEELKKKTPKTQKGNYAARFHQSLTADIGQVHLDKQLISVITLMKVSANWQDFLRNFQKLYGQLEIDFPT